MIGLDELAGIVQQWEKTRLIDAGLLQPLKTQWLAELGVDRCTTCPHWQTDMMMHFRSQLKQAGIPMATDNRKYRLKESVGTLLVGQLHYVNHGKDSEHVRVLTDEISAKLMKEGFGELFEKNPDYAPKAEGAKPAATEAAKKKKKSKPAPKPDVTPAGDEQPDTKEDSQTPDE